MTVKTPIADWKAVEVDGKSIDGGFAEAPEPLRKTASWLLLNTGLNGEYNDGAFLLSADGETLFITARGTTACLHSSWMEAIQGYDKVRITTLTVDDGRPAVEVRTA